MKKEFCTYEIAKKLKDLGFNEPCFGNYGNENAWMCDMGVGSFHRVDHTNSKDCGYAISAPLWQQAIDWLEKKYDIYIELSRTYVRGYYTYEYFINIHNSLYSLDSSYKARELSILKAIELITNNMKNE